MLSSRFILIGRVALKILHFLVTPVAMPLPTWSTIWLQIGKGFRFLGDRNH